MPGCYSLPRRLTYTASNCYDACSLISDSNYYSDYSGFTVGGLVYQNSGCTTLAVQGYYSDILDGGNTCYQINSSGQIITTGICFSTTIKLQDCYNSSNVFRFNGVGLPSIIGNTYYISNTSFFEGCATLITNDNIGDLYDGSGVIFTLVTDCNDLLCPPCNYIEYCFGTTNPILSGYSGNFTSAGTYNFKTSYTGDGTSGGIIYYTGDRWCLSNTLAGTCLLEGKSPWNSGCPDLAYNSFDFGPCPTPTPTPVGNFAIDFDAYFDVAYIPPITPTPSIDCADVNFSIINSPIPPTPSASPIYNLGVNFSIYYSSPTPTPSITATPTPTATNILEILGKATFTIIDPPFDCSTVKVLLECGTVNNYYYVSGPIMFNSVQLVVGTTFNANITSPSGTKWVCVKYLRDDPNLSTDTTINSVYSLFGKCEDCLPIPSQTPTPTPTYTPTQTNTGIPLTPSYTQTPTQTSTQTPTQTPTNTETPTQTPTQTNTETPTQTPTQTITQTPSPTEPLNNFTGIFDTRNTNYIFDLVNFANNNRATANINISALTITLNGIPTTVISTAASRTSEQIRQSIQSVFPSPVIVYSYVGYKYDIITTGGTDNIFGTADVGITGLGSLTSVTPTTSSAFNEITLPFISGAGTNYNCIVDWGDGGPTDYITSWSAANRTHTYSTPGIYTVNIYAKPGNLSGIQYAKAGGFNPSINEAEKYKILEVVKWGSLRLGNQSNYFDTCRNLILTGTTDVLDLTNTSSLFYCFYYCTSLTTINRVNEWDTSNIQNLGNTFAYATNFNDDLSGWTTSAVTFMQFTFSSALKFNKDIGSWDTHKCGNMGHMFATAREYDNGGSNSISGWTMSANTTIGYMFYQANKFNRNIAGWERNTPNEYGYLSDMKKTTESNYAFSEAYLFNNGLPSGDGSGDGLNSWTTTGITNMGHMFHIASSFNQPLSAWNVSNVTTISFLDGMQNMFYGTKFNQDISNWERTTPDVSTFGNVRRASGMFANCPFNNGGNPNISNWVTTGLTGNVGMTLMFQGNTAFDQPIGSWDTRNVGNMTSVFQGATSFKQDIGNWITSGVSSMSNMFLNATSFSGTPSMSGWDVSKVEDMTSMFFNSKFDQNISNWNVSKVKLMTSMFRATPFDNGGSPDISGWTTSAVTNMANMFYSNSTFNQPIDDWDVSNVKSTNSMFYSASFNQPLSSWITSALTNTAYMFYYATNFDQDLGNWDVSNVQDMTGMFGGGIFNNSGSTTISGWTTSAVTSMNGMFTSNTKFNQPIGNWDTSSVMNMGSMFNTTVAFNQPIGNWNVSAVTNFTNFMLGKTPLTFSATNLTDIYTGWTSGGKTVVTGRTITFGTAKYTTDGQSGKDLLTGSTLSGGYGWNITDGGVAP